MFQTNNFTCNVFVSRCPHKLMSTALPHELYITTHCKCHIRPAKCIFKGKYTETLQFGDILAAILAAILELDR